MFDDGFWRDERIPWLVAAALGMLSGVAAKQAVSISKGEKLTKLSLLADVLVLGVVFIIVMYIRRVVPAIPIEGIAFIGAALAMWGPRGVARLVDAIRRRTFKQVGLEVEEVVHTEMVFPVNQPPSNVPRHSPMTETQEANFSSIEKLRDKSPVELAIPADLLKSLARLDEWERNKLLEELRRKAPEDDEDEGGQ